MRCSASAAVLAVSRMNDPLSGFGSSSECDPKRSQRPLRIAAAFVRFRPLQRVWSRARSPDAPVRRFRLRRFDAPDVSHAHGLRLDFSRRPLLGFTLRSFSLSLWPRLAVASGARAAPRTSLAACRLAHARLPFTDGATRRINSWTVRLPVGFRALLPLRIRPSPAAFWVANDPLLPWGLPL